MLDQDSHGAGYNSGLWSGDSSFQTGSSAQIGAMWREQDEARAAAREAQLAADRESTAKWVAANSWNEPSTSSSSSLSTTYYSSYDHGSSGRASGHSSNSDNSDNNGFAAFAGIAFLCAIGWFVLGGAGKVTPSGQQEAVVSQSRTGNQRTSTYDGKTFGYVGVQDLRLRKGPGVRFAIDRKLQRGTHVKILANAGNDWLIIAMTDQDGRVHAGYVYGPMIDR